MMVQEYKRAFFLGSLSDNFSGKSAALYNRKSELEEITKYGTLSPSDKAESQKELRDIKEEISKVESKKRQEKQDETPAAEVSFKNFVMKADDRILSEEEEQKAVENAEQAKETLKNNDISLEVQANMPSADVLALLG